MVWLASYKAVPDSRLAGRAKDTALRTDPLVRCYAALYAGAFAYRSKTLPHAACGHDAGRTWPLQRFDYSEY